MTTPPAWAMALREDGLAIEPPTLASAFLKGTVMELDMFTATGLRTFTLGGTPQGMAITRKGDRLYVANEAGYLTEITLQSGAITATMTLSGGGFGVGVTADDNQA